MLSQEQIEEIKGHLERAQNPIFLFDNDCDGLISFILLRRFIDRGKGVAIKSFPELDESYLRRVEEFGSDYIFVLDKPQISKEFIEEARKKSIPIVWIDHHDVNPGLEGVSNVSYYNPIYSKEKSSEPTSFLAYSIAGVKKDNWLAMIGCVADNFLPDFSEEVIKEHKELFSKHPKSAFDILYESEFGKLVSMLSFGLKDRTSNVVAMINLLFKINSPSEILTEDEKNFKIRKRYESVNSVYQKLLDKAKRVARASKKVVFFQYGGELSMSADIANEISYRFPGKVVIVAYLKGSIANVSIRGKSVRNATLRVVEAIEGSRGGGHEHATGAKVSVEDLDKLRKIFEDEFED